MKIFTTIITNVLTALYQPFWFSIILAVFFMFVYKRYPSVKQAAKDWISWFKSDPTFRRTFLLVFYTVMILFRTLLNRNMWSNPVSNVIGVWGLYNAKGELTTECIENLVLFIPFTVLLLWVAKDRILKRMTMGYVPCFRPPLTERRSCLFFPALQHKIQESVLEMRTREYISNR